MHRATPPPSPLPVYSAPEDQCKLAARPGAEQWHKEEEEDNDEQSTQNVSAMALQRKLTMPMQALAM
jgi:hypothetical protein